MEGFVYFRVFFGFLMEFLFYILVYWIGEQIYIFILLKVLFGMLLLIVYRGFGFFFSKQRLTKQGGLVTQIFIRYFTVFILDSEVYRIYFQGSLLLKKGEGRRWEQYYVVTLVERRVLLCFFYIDLVAIDVRAQFFSF